MPNDHEWLVYERWAKETGESDIHVADLDAL